MTRFWWLGPAFGILGFGVGAWLRHQWLAKAAQLADAEIAARGYSYRFEGHDDSLRVKTEAKRQAADRMRTRAARVETGSKVSEILRMVK